MVSMQQLWRTLKSGGMYFVEDVQEAGLNYWRAMGTTTWERGKGGRGDDVLICVRKH
jgi:hypothetical protein